VAKKRFEKLTAQKPQKEELASKVYALFTTGIEASKAIAAQYLAERLERRVKDGELTAETLKTCLPLYLVTAIEYATPFSGANGAAKKNMAEAHE
jgi:putative ATP-dependent endonuclease of OLD family